MTEQAVPPAATIDDGVVRWLREFADFVRCRDYERGATLFDPDVVGFGTVAARADGLEALVRGQWRHVWGVTERFDFDWDGIRGDRRGDRAWVAARWSSTGFATDGSPSRAAAARRSCSRARRAARGGPCTRTSRSTRRAPPRGDPLRRHRGPRLHDPRVPRRVGAAVAGRRPHRAVGARALDGSRGGGVDPVGSRAPDGSRTPHRDRFPAASRARGLRCAC